LPVKATEALPPPLPAVAAIPDGFRGEPLEGDGYFDWKRGEDCVIIEKEVILNLS